MTNVHTSTPLLTKKRERTQNWVPEEKRALFSLIKGHINAIENKKIDTSATALKSLAWRQIYCDFKGKFSTERDITRMREQWRRMKAQARVDINAFAEQVRTVGIEDASKSRPSDLSADIWRLLKFIKKNENEGTSDDSQDADPSSNLQEILDNLDSAPFEASLEVLKEECVSEFNDESPSIEGSFAHSPTPERSRVRVFAEQPINLVHQKRIRLSIPSSGAEDERDPTLVFDDMNEPIKRSFEYDSAAEERNIKLKILGMEIERVELQKQTAYNELKTSEIRKQLAESQAIEYFSQVRMAGEAGSGAGKGGGGGGAIRSAGGSFGKMEAAHEDQYFYNQQKEQLQHLREGLHDEISFHEEQIKRHQEAINRHKQRITDMEHK